MQYFLIENSDRRCSSRGVISWNIDAALSVKDYDNFISALCKYSDRNQKLLHYSVDESYPHFNQKEFVPKFCFLMGALLDLKRRLFCT